MRALVFIVATCGGLVLSFVGLVFSMAVDGTHGIPTFTYVLGGMLAVAHVIAVALAARKPGDTRQAPPLDHPRLRDALCRLICAA